MDIQLPFSPEMNELEHVPGLTMSEKYTYIVAQTGMRKHIADVHEHLRGNPTYTTMLGVCGDIRQTVSQESDVAAGYGDGSALAIDVVNRFAPQLSPLLQERTEDVLKEISDRAKAYEHVSQIEEKKRFVLLVRWDTKSHLKDHAKDYQAVLDSIQRHRRYGVEGYAALKEGFSFVMERGFEAYEEDLKELRAFADDLEQQADQSIRNSNRPNEVSSRAPADFTAIDIAIAEFFRAEAGKHKQQ